MMDPSLLGAARDLVIDLATAPRRVALAREALGAAPQRVLAVSVARPERAGSSAAAAYELERTRVHSVDVRLAAPRPGTSKWESLDALLAHTPAAGYDWLLAFDDDVILPRGFLDTFLALCERFELTLAQPARRHWASHPAPAGLRRRSRGLVRRTAAHAVGPIFALHARGFDAVLPLAQARFDGLAHGIVDATPVRY